jgi:hypothetical protein
MYSQQGSGPTPEQINQLVFEILTDPEFRKRFLDDPAAAAAELGITLTQEQIDYINSLNDGVLEGCASAINSEADSEILRAWRALHGEGARPIQ